MLVRDMGLLPAAGRTDIVLLLAGADRVGRTRLLRQGGSKII